MQVEEKTGSGGGNEGFVRGISWIVQVDGCCCPPPLPPPSPPSTPSVTPSCESCSIVCSLYLVVHLQIALGSLCLSVYLSIFLVCLTFFPCLSFHFFVCLHMPPDMFFVRLFVCQSLPVCPCIFVSASVFASVTVSVCLSVFVCFCHFVSVSLIPNLLPPQSRFQSDATSTSVSLSV